MARRAVSVSSAAAELARGLLGKLEDKSVLIVGAGKMAKLCAKSLLNEDGKGPVLMVNRTAQKVGLFAQTKLPNRHRLNPSFSFADRYLLAAAADLVVVSTTAAELILEFEQFAKLHNEKPICIIDMSVPRNVDPRIGELKGVRLFHTDQLSEIVDKNLAERESLISQAQTIVFETLAEFHAWQRSLLVVPTIARLRQKIESIREEQMQKTGLSSHEDLLQLEQVSRAIINRILHHPTVKLKSTNDERQLLRQAQTLQTLFELDVFDRDFS